MMKSCVIACALLAAAVSAAVPEIVFAPMTFENIDQDPISLSRKVAFEAAVAQINSDPRYNTLFSLRAHYIDTKKNATSVEPLTRAAIMDGAVAVLHSTSSADATVVLSKFPMVPVVSSGAGNGPFSSAADYPYFLRDIPAFAQIDCLGSILKQRAPKDIAATTFSYTDSAYIGLRDAAKTVFAQNNIGVKSNQEYTDRSNPMAPAALNPAVSNARYLFISAHQIDYAYILKSMKNFQKPLIVMGIDVALTPAADPFTINGTVDADALEVGQNFFGCGLDSAKGETAYTTFKNRYDAVRVGYPKAPATPDVKASYAWDTVYILAEASKALIDAGKNVTAGAELIAAMRAVNFQGASNRIYFPAGVNEPPGPYHYQVLSWRKGTDGKPMLKELGTFYNNTLTGAAAADFNFPTPKISGAASAKPALAVLFAMIVAMFLVKV